MYNISSKDFIKLLKTKFGRTHFLAEELMRDTKIHTTLQHILVPKQLNRLIASDYQCYITFTKIKQGLGKKKTKKKN